jgi:hypothetical protein
MKPPRPRRIRNLLYGFAMQAQEEALQMAGYRIQRQRGG